MCDGAPETDVGHRLLHLVPTPSREVKKDRSKFAVGDWEPGYALSPATENWAKQVRDASPDDTSQTIGFVGATSAGKSWLISKLQSEDGAKPATVEGTLDSALLQSVTSDINLYVDPLDHLYYIDFEGTHGTQPLQLRSRELWEVVQHCSDMAAWESKRRQALKESVQPAIAYLMCNIVVFLTREKLVCRRALEECEQFALTANKKVLSALPPALIIVQNCCRPSEGFFDVEQCTAAFKQAHLNGMTSWEKYFRSIDCFCIPDEFTFCKRSGFDGEEVCAKVIESLRTTIRQRLAQDIAARLQGGIRLTQLQWFPVLSTLCSIVNDRECVEMSSIYIHASAVGDSMADLKSMVLNVMALPEIHKDGLFDKALFEGRLQASIGIVARFAVLREFSNEELDEVVAYLLALFPCGAEVPPEVERADGRSEPAVCGQCHLLHTSLHRSSVFVRTVQPDWLQGLSEWLMGGMTYAWPGAFICHPAVAEAYSATDLRAAIDAEIAEYRLEKCLEGLSSTMGAPWVLKAVSSMRKSLMDIRQDNSSTCAICMTKGTDPGVFWRLLIRSVGNFLPVCGNCNGMMEKHGLSIKRARASSAVEPELQEQRCAVCKATSSQARTTDHRLHPCKCAVCSACSERIAAQDWPVCPLCGSAFRWIADERALLGTGWRVVRACSGKEKSRGMCTGR